jgi:hypothetical protein
MATFRFNSSMQNIKIENEKKKNLNFIPIYILN